MRQGKEEKRKQATKIFTLVFHLKSRHTDTHRHTHTHTHMLLLSRFSRVRLCATP